MNIDKLKSKGSTYFKKGNYASALNQWQIAVDLIDIKQHLNPDRLLLKKMLLSNMSAAYTKLEMYHEAIESGEQALQVVHSINDSSAETVEKSNDMSLKIHVRLALAYEKKGGLHDHRQALAALVRSIPSQRSFKRTIFHNELVGLSPRHERQGKAVPKSTRKIFERIYKKLYGSEATFSVGATPNLCTNMERPWSTNAGWCRVSEDSDIILYWSGHIQKKNSKDFNHPLMQRLAENPACIQSFSRAEREIVEGMFSTKVVEPSTLYFYNTFTKLWKMERCVGNVPPGRQGHKLVRLNSKFYVWGGKGAGSGGLSMMGGASSGNPDMWELELSTKTWTKIVTRNGKAPYSGSIFNFVSFSYEENNSIYFIGGEMSGDYFNTIHRFKLWGDGTGSWEEIIPIAASAANGVGKTCKETLRKKDKKKVKKKKDKKKSYVPLQRSLAAGLQHGDNGECILIHGGEVNSEHSTECLERFNLRTHCMEACPLLGPSPTLRSEHVLFSFRYQNDPKKKLYGLCCGGYIPEIGSRMQKFRSRKVIDHEFQLYDETSHMSSRGITTGYRNSMYRLDLETLVWVRLSDSFGKFVQAAEQFGIQRNDGTLVLGGGYGPIRASEEEVAAGFGTCPESLWHTYELQLDDCGDVTPYALLHSPLLRSLAEGHAEGIREDGSCETTDQIDQKEENADGDNIPFAVPWAGYDAGIRWKSQRSDNVFFYLAENRPHWLPPHCPLRGINVYVFRHIQHKNGGYQVAFDTYRGPINKYNKMILDLSAPNLEPMELLDMVIESETDYDGFSNRPMDEKWNVFVKNFVSQSRPISAMLQQYDENYASGMILNAASPLEVAGDSAEEDDDQENRDFSGGFYEMVRSITEKLPPESGLDQVMEYIEDKWGDQEIDCAQATARRSEELRARREDAKKVPSGKVFVLKIIIQDIEPAIHRTVTVTDTITLHQLHEQVIAPSVGWQQQYHAYAFRPTLWDNDGTTSNDWIGPKNSTANDARLMMNFFGGGFVANSNKVELRHLLLHKHDSLHYVYDLGDYWLHKIELVNVFTREEQAPFCILDGWGNCPPEDIGGPIKYCTFINGLLEQSQGSAKWPPSPDWRGPSFSHEEWIDGCTEIMNSCFIGKGNVPGIRFDPAKYDMEFAQNRLDTAVREKVSKTKKSDGFIQSDLYGNDSEKGRRMAPEGKGYAEPQKSGEERKSKVRGTKICAVCGITAGLTRCSRCEKISYCGPQCQKSDWKRHKNAECVKKEKKTTTTTTTTTTTKKNKKKKKKKN